MEKNSIINIGKTVFAFSFLLGNFCLFGYLFTKNEEYAFAGLILLFFGSILNLGVIAGLLIYGFLHKNKLETCIKSSMILLINIPVAIVYAVIGLNIIN
ncbi:branched-chain amino acid:cation transporter, LIVCS family [Chryseobacterium soldanellicola]|uniref:Branched-chain amino acid:cation transporter, LIVCS family n=1 Tax=Chryseobacterium soldanellicola TaxID=311333 RepID=A0A1H0ZRU3_9FLAO|nr:hypothetical protein [Chryseobacterium soldanellicola]SDQ29941.1 branched-chain amino acid:cation transporter, LIVCS family [Chryseobacterium soldanellicola]